MPNEAWIIWLDGEPVGVRSEQTAAKFYATGLVGSAEGVFHISGPHSPGDITYSRGVKLIKEAKEARNGN